MQDIATTFISKLNEEIKSLQSQKQPRELYEPIDYIMGLGGKRTRPLLTLLSNNLFTDDLTAAYKPALAIEVFHNFTLMHDDIMDRAPLRRGNKTVHEKWNNNVAIISGDVMLIKAYELFTELNQDVLPETLKAFNQCAAEVCEGQQLDMNFESQANVTEQDYLNMIRLKTAALLGFSLELGGILAKTTDKNKALLKELGINMGMSFQLMDDLLDVYGDHEKFGKQVGGDIAENKKTFLTIKAFEKATGKDLEVLKKHFSSKQENNTSKIKEVTAIYDKLNIKAEIEDKINFYFEKCKVNLLHIDASFSKKALLRKLAANFANERELILNDYSIHRTYSLIAFDMLLSK